MKSALPDTLRWRVFLLIVPLIALSTLVWVIIIEKSQEEQSAYQFAETLVSVANLTRTALVSSRPESRRQLLADLSDQEGIRIYPTEANDRIEPVSAREKYYLVVDRVLRTKLGSNTQLTLSLNGQPGIFFDFHLDNNPHSDSYWIALPKTRATIRPIGTTLLLWIAAATLLALIGGWLIAWRTNERLSLLTKAANEIGHGGIAAPIPESGPREIRTLAHAFNKMNTSLKQLADNRAQMLAGISHDLRTPLTRLRMSLELMPMDAQLRHESITDIEQMNQTIGQFLDFSRDADGESLCTTDLSSLLHDLANTYRALGAEIQCAANPPFSLAVRPGALRRALLNLIENALRHAGKTAPISLCLHQTERMVNLDVMDQGPGIPQHRIEDAKRPFTRLETARTSAQGAGLGLSIVERIAQQHNGQLLLLPNTPQGLIARIALPLPDKTRTPSIRLPGQADQPKSG